MPHVFAGEPEKVARKNEYLETLNLSRKRGEFCYFEAQDDCRPEKKGRSEERDRSACSFIVEQRLQPACGKDGSRNVIFQDRNSSFLPKLNKKQEVIEENVVCPQFAPFPLFPTGFEFRECRGLPQIHDDLAENPLYSLLPASDRVENTEQLERHQGVSSYAFFVISRQDPRFPCLLPADETGRAVT